MLPSGFESWEPFLRAQYLETKHLLPGYILSSQGDRVAMAYSVEGRFPFLDYRVADFAARLPSRLKMRVLQEKHLLKRVAGPLIPPMILKRRKQPYRAPDAASFFGPGKADYVEELLSPERVRRDGIFEPASVSRLVEKCRVGRATGTADNMALVGILSTQLLIDNFFPQGC
jgi:asparagine synthase (glutamine-hydrolysing)